MKDPKDILKAMGADISGVSPDKVTFSNFRDRKKKKKKIKKTVESESYDGIIENSEGFAITGVNVEFCSYDKIKGKKKVVQKSSLEEWGAFDFFYYADKKYIEKYGIKTNLNVGGNSVEINRIRDKLYDIFGFCCNLIMRDYIDFFFDYYIDTIVREDGSFYFRQMRNDKIICEFCDGYNFPQSFLRYTEGENTLIKRCVSSAEIKDSYQIGNTSLVSNYGIVLSVNWLIKVRKENPTDAVRVVIDACRDLAVNGMIEVVKSSTDSYSPYPSFMLFKKPQLIMDRVDKRVKLDVEFCDNDKYGFLQ